MNKMAKGISIGAAALALVMLLQTQNASAQDPAQPSAFGQLARNLNPMNWKMPNFGSLLPGNDEKARIKKKKDGLFDEVGKTASNSWSKTKAALDPQKLNPVNYLPASSRTPSPKKPEQTKPGFFRSLFAPSAEPERQDGTVTGFLSQPRP